MKIDDSQKLYSDYIRNEIETLNRIKNFGGIATNFPLLHEQANTLSSIFMNRDLTKSDFIFSFELQMEVENDYRSVFVEANFKVNYSLATYCLSICDTILDQKELIRKFHFDFEVANTTNFFEKKPKYHLQFGGKQTAILTKKNISVDNLYPWLSVPRITIAPVNLALLLDFIFCEFPSEVTKKITEDSRWRELIVINERYILNEYITNLYSIIAGKNHKSTYLLRDYMYGNPVP